MILTAENYFSKEADREYLSVSQYKKFMGTLGRVGCEAEALACLVSFAFIYAKRKHYHYA